MIANEIKAALYLKLTGSAAITSLLSGTAAVYDSIAPNEATLPLVIFSKQDGRPVNRMGGVAYESHVYLVKGVTEGESAALAGSVAKAIDAALNNTTLTISGYTQMLCRRNGEVDYPESDEGRTIRHIGATYKIEAT